MATQNPIMNNEDVLELVNRAAPAFEAQKKVASLEVEVSILKTAAEKREESLKIAADKAAEFFSQCGLLKAANREAFVTRLSEDPSEIFETVQKYAERLASLQPGMGGSTSDIVESERPDSKFIQFAMNS